MRQPSVSTDARPQSGPDDFSVTRGREPIGPNQTEASTVTLVDHQFLIIELLRCRSFLLDAEVQEICAPHLAIAGSHP